MTETLPDTRLVQEAAALLDAAASPAVRNHCRRCYGLGRAYAARERLAVDPEDLALAVLFHDAGLCAPWADPARAFPLNGARAARSYLAERGQPEARGGAVAEAIALHTQLWPRWSAGPLAGVLQVSAWMDVFGLRRGGFRAEARELEQAWPRLGFLGEFGRAMGGQLVRPRCALGLLFPHAFP